MDTAKPLAQGPLIRGAMVEYRSELFGALPNIVLFQFNPESLTRSFQISRPTSATGTAERPEVSQSGVQPFERISLTAFFNATDQMNKANPLALSFGVGPQLAALEKMAVPLPDETSLESTTVDAVASEATANQGSTATQPTPRRKFPTILFIWGPSRLLPVVIDSLSINEKQFDARLNPIDAEVTLGLSVLTESVYLEDRLAKGALKYTNGFRDAMAVMNLANIATSAVIEVIPF